MTQYRIILTLLAIATLGTTTTALAHPNSFASFEDRIIARSGDAYIAYDSESQTWEIGTAGIARRMDFDANGGYHLAGFVNKHTKREWLAPGSGESAELHMILNGEEMVGASRDFQFHHFSTAVNKDKSLELHIGLTRDNLHVDFTYVAFPNTSVIEQWTTLINTGISPIENITTFDSFSVAVRPSIDPLTLYWVQGVSPTIPDQSKSDPVPSLRLRSIVLDDNVEQRVGSNGRSSQDSMGWFVLASPALREGMFGGIEWSGAWQLSATRTRGQTELRAGIGEIRKNIMPGEQFESPRRFIGFYRGDLDEATNSSHQFARTYLMRPRPANFPWTQYNSWFAYYTDFDETILRREADAAKELGLEVFYVDAGWYEGSPRIADFSFGLGTWRENREKFPSGLRALADYVHGKGLNSGCGSNQNASICVTSVQAGGATRMDGAWHGSTYGERAR
jgi:hypothetical protein